MGRYRNNFFNWLVKKRTTFGWIFFILVAIFSKGTIKNLLYGIPLIFIGEFLRIVSSGIIMKNEELAKNGIYGICRHPLYLGSFFISIGFTIASSSIFILIYFLLFFPLIYTLTIIKEEKFLEEKFKHEFEIYKKQIPAFFPRLRKINIFCGFSKKQFIENKEYVNLIALFLLIVILLIKSKNKL